MKNKQSINITSTRKAKTNPSLLDAKVPILPLLQSIPVVEYKYKHHLSDSKNQIGILAEDTYYQSNIDNVGGNNITDFLNGLNYLGIEDRGSIGAYDYKKLDVERNYQASNSTSIKYTLKKDPDYNKSQEYLRAILDQQNKGQNLVSSVGLLLKGVQELTDRVMFLENQVIGDDFVNVKGWAEQLDSNGGIPEGLDDNDLKIDNLTYGLTRVVKALAKRSLGNYNPSKDNMKQPTAGGNGYDSIEALIKKIQDLEGRLTPIEQDITAIKTSIADIQGKINTININIGGINTNTAMLVSGFNNTDTLKGLLSSISGKFTDSATINAMADAVNTKLTKNENGSLLNIITDKINNAVMFITGVASYPTPLGGPSFGDTLTNINAVLKKFKKNDVLTRGRLLGTLQVKNALPPNTVIEFKEAEVVFGTNASANHTPVNNNEAIPFARLDGGQ